MDFVFFPLGLSNFWVGAWFPFDEGQFRGGDFLNIDKAPFLDSKDYKYKWRGSIRQQMELMKDMQMIKEEQWAYERHFYFIDPNNLKNVLGKQPNFINIMRDPIG